MSCAIKWCGRSSKTSNMSKDEISFHRFPKDPKIRQKWIDRSKRQNWAPTKFSSVCSRHFEKDCFHIMKCGRRRLYDTAIPTLNLPVIKNYVNDESSSSSLNFTPIAPKASTEPVLYLVMPPQNDGSNNNQKTSVKKEPPVLSSAKNQTKLVRIKPKPSPEPVDPLEETVTSSEPQISTVNETETSVQLVTPSTTVREEQLKLELKSTHKKHSTLNDPEPGMDSMDKKKLCRRIVELSRKIVKKNKVVKNLRDRIRYLEKRVVQLDNTVNELQGTKPIKKGEEELQIDDNESRDSQKSEDDDDED